MLRASPATHSSWPSGRAGKSGSRKQVRTIEEANRVGRPVGSRAAVCWCPWPRVIKTPTGQAIPYEDQSFGTREQVGVLYRLAGADLLKGSDDRGMCLMLDDPFGHTDRGRRQNMLEILQAAASRSGHQILVFTCRPEDFAGVEQHVDVSATKARS